MTLLRSLSLFGAKTVATFFVMVGLFLLCMTFYPEAINWLLRMADGLENELRSYDVFQAREDNLFRLLVDDMALFGIFLTVIARTIVELLAFLFGGLWRLGGSNADEVIVAEPVGPGHPHV